MRPSAKHCLVLGALLWLSTLALAGNDPGAPDPIPVATPTPTPTPEAAKKEEASGPEVKNNVLFGLNFVFPMVAYQRVVAPHYSIGADVQVVSYTPESGGKLNGIGVLLVGDYYAGDSLNGTWLRTGLGLYSLTATAGGASQSLSSPVLTATIGWRWIWDSGLNFGMAGGMTFLFNHRADTVGVSFSGLLPSLILDFGFAY